MESLYIRKDFYDICLINKCYISSVHNFKKFSYVTRSNSNPIIPDKKVIYHDKLKD